MSTVSAATIATQITEQAQQPAGPIQIDPVEKAEILANQAPIALLAEHEDEAEEARQQIAQVNLLQEEEVKQISSVSTEDISTSNLKSYLERELGNLENDEMEIYNVLQCPVGDIQGDEQEITNQLERTYTASIIELSLDNTRQRLPTFDSQINKVIQVVSSIKLLFYTLTVDIYSYSQHVQTKECSLRVWPQVLMVIRPHRRSSRLARFMTNESSSCSSTKRFCSSWEVS